MAGLDHPIMALLHDLARDFNMQVTQRDDLLRRHAIGHELLFHRRNLRHVGRADQVP